MYWPFMAIDLGVSRTLKSKIELDKIYISIVMDKRNVRECVKQDCKSSRKHKKQELNKKIVAWDRFTVLTNHLVFATKLETKKWNKRNSSYPYLGAFLLHLFKVPSDALRDLWLGDPHVDNFNTWGISCAVALKSFFHLLINLQQKCIITKKKQ